MIQERRSMKDRREVKDRRRILSMQRWRYKDIEKRETKHRRAIGERRDGWVRLGKWSSAHLADLNIGRFLKW